MASHLIESIVQLGLSQKIAQPRWLNPAAASTSTPLLKLYNSLTKQKEIFVPKNHRNVTWYTCGPTVYAQSHIGHARAFLTSDIIRRILEDYFNYNVLFVMNITDIDDKIIIATRHKLLFDEYLAAQISLSHSLIHECKTSCDEYIIAKFGKFADGLASSDWSRFLVEWAPGSKLSPIPEVEPKYSMYFKIAKRAKEALDIAEQHLAQGSTALEFAATLCLGNQDPLSLHLDNQKGHLITDEKPYREFARFYEDDFFEDMDTLNIRRPDIKTRVTEYVPEIVAFVEKIIANNFAYVAPDGSVYFDTVRFNNDPDHFYAKLSPWSAGDLKLLAEGEGDLSNDPASLDGKRNKPDFALWKASKAGEPAWPSPWGPGRPGWHIECSVMASHVLGDNFDIHSGGIDLAFPHHDNEIAQSEAFHNCKQWVNYFLHTGHLHIEGQKMSKSLKNFISIKEACKTHSPIHIRILFLLHTWESTLHFDESTLKESRDFETRLNNFFVNVKAEILQKAHNPPPFTGRNDFGLEEAALLKELAAKQNSIHAALCDSFNTPKAMLDIKDLVASANSYRNDIIKLDNRTVNTEVILKIAKYVMRMMKCFGVVNSDLVLGLNMASSVESGASDVESVAAPFLKVLAEYRDGVRSLAQTKAEFLKFSDHVRDFELVELGVALDDRADGKSLVKFVDKSVLLAQKLDKVKKEEARQLERAARLLEQARLKEEKLAKGKSAPDQLFRDATSCALYSKWDAQGIPTYDAEGVEITKSRRKKLLKEFEVQVKLHDEYLKSLEVEN